MTAPGGGVRLQKVLARAGIASRRAAEALIAAGRVRVDGRIVRELGVRVHPSKARVEVDGRRIVAEPFVYLVLHKPRGVVSTLSDPEGRPTVGELLREAGARVVPVGRLDFQTSGALICTNDGALAQKLAHPRHHAEKEYVVKVKGPIGDAELARLRESIVIDGRATKPARVQKLRSEGDKVWLSFKLGEGRNRQVRRLCEHAGLGVMRLVRTTQAGVSVDGVPPGQFRFLSDEEIASLKDPPVHRTPAAGPQTKSSAGAKPRAGARRAPARPSGQRARPSAPARGSSGRRGT